LSSGFNKQNELIAEFRITWSFKINHDWPCLCRTNFLITSVSPINERTGPGNAIQKLLSNLYKELNSFRRVKCFKVNCFCPLSFVLNFRHQYHQVWKR
jgi:hypothetical protein